MITQETFFAEFNGHANAYSSYMLIGVTPKQVIDMLNNYHRAGFKPEHVGSGCYNEATRSVSFEICKGLPDEIHAFTSALQCKGFADIDAWYGHPYCECSENGHDTDKFYAYWDEGQEPYHDDPDKEDEWNAFFTLVDPDTGAEFGTGAGAVDTEIKEEFETIVNRHPCPPGLVR